MAFVSWRAEDRAECGTKEARGAPRTFDGNGWVWSTGHAVGRVFASAFLPAGWPNTTPPDYLAYQSMDTLQALCSYLRGILTMRAVLQGLGVGDASKSVLSSTLTWVLKDGASLATGLAFSWAAAARVDANPKFFRLVADISNDVALTIELLAPLFAAWYAGLGDPLRTPAARAVDSSLAFFACLCVANALKAVCGVAAGCVRVVLAQHFAREHNAADINAKEASQETAVTLVGMVAGSFALAPLDDSPRLQWAAFFLLTAVHVWANWRAVSALRLGTLNRNRIDSGLRSIAASGALSAMLASDGGAEAEGHKLLKCGLGADPVGTVNAGDAVWPSAGWAPAAGGPAAAALAFGSVALVEGAWDLAVWATTIALWPIRIAASLAAALALSVPGTRACVSGTMRGAHLDAAIARESELSSGERVATAHPRAYSAALAVRVGAPWEAVGPAERRAIEASPGRMRSLVAQLSSRGWAVVASEPRGTLLGATRTLYVLLAPAPAGERQEAAAAGYCEAWLWKEWLAGSGSAAGLAAEHSGAAGRWAALTKGGLDTPAPDAAHAVLASMRDALSQGGTADCCALDVGDEGWSVGHALPSALKSD